MLVQEICRSSTITHNYLTLAVNNKEGFIGFDRKTGQVQVICKNASHKAFFGAGRFFDNFDLALAAYKSSVMKTIISTAREHITENPEEYNKIASDSIERYL